MLLSRDGDGCEEIGMIVPSMLDFQRRESKNEIVYTFSHINYTLGGHQHGLCARIVENKTRERLHIVGGQQVF